MEKVYYEINEKMAKDSRAMWSFFDYKEGSATAEYRNAVDRAYELINEVPAEYQEKAFYFADLYARKLAENTNKRFAIDMRCPSVMVAGPANFPTRKKEKQNEASRKNYEEWKYISGYLEKIKNLKTYVPKAINAGTDNGKDYSNPYFKVVQNEELNRLQLKFEGKPTDYQRDLLKKSGWKWSPNNGVWQRKLTDNARANMKYLISKFGQTI